MQILTKNISSISELKANPMKVVNSGNGEAVTILNHNKPAFYCIPASSYQDMQNTPQWHLDILEKLDSKEHNLTSFDKTISEMEAL
jgi:antitoxin StbD